MEVTFGDDEDEEVFLDAADENWRVSCCLARISLCSACLCFFQSSTDVAVLPAAADEGVVTVGVEATAVFLEVALLLLLLLTLPLADSWLLPLLDLVLLLLLVEGIDADEGEDVAVLEPLELLLAFLLGGATCAGVLLLFLFCRVIVFFSSTSDSDDSSLSLSPLLLAVAPATPVVVVLAPLFFFLFFFFLDFADVLSFPNAPGRDDLFSFET